MLAVSWYLIWFNSWRKTPQTEFSILVVFSFLSFFFWKANLVNLENFAYRYLVFACSCCRDKRNRRGWTGQGNSIKTCFFFKKKKKRLKKNRWCNELCFSTVNVGWQLSELPCCAQGQLKLKNEHGNDIFDGEGFLLQQSSKNARANSSAYFVLI